MSVAFNRLGTKIVSGGGGGTVGEVILWDLSGSEDSIAFQPLPGQIRQVFVNQNGERLVTGNQDGSFTLWDPGNGQTIRTFDGHKRPDNDNGSWTPGRGMSSPPPNILRVTSSIDFSPDNAQVVSGGSDGKVKMWDVGTGAVKFETQLQQRQNGTLAAKIARINSVRFSPQGDRIAYASMQPEVSILDAANGRELLTLEGHEDGVNGIQFSPMEIGW